MNGIDAGESLGYLGERRRLDKRFHVMERTMSKNHAVRNILCLAFFGLALIGGLFSPVHAGHIACGDVLGPGGVFELDSDVGPCDNSSAGFAIAVNAAVLDTNGFTIFCEDTNGDTVLPDGLLVLGNSAVITSAMGRSIVRACHDGVVVQGNRHNVEKIAATENTEDGFDLTGDRNQLFDTVAQTNASNGYSINGNANDVLTTDSLGQRRRRVFDQRRTQQAGRQHCPWQHCLRIRCTRKQERADR